MIPKKILALFFLVFFHVQLAQAQWNSEDLYWTTTQLKKNNLHAGFNNNGYALLKGTFLYNSTAVTNDFVTQELYQQKTPSADDTQPSVDRLKDHNRLGLDVNVSASGGFRLPSDTSLMIDIGVAYRDFSYLYFTRDLFKLAFQDYTQYVDKYAQIGESNMREYNYASVFVGAQKVLSKNFLIGARASLIKGGFYQEVNIERGTLHLSQGSLFVPPTADINAPFQYYSQQRQSNPFSADNGWGAGLDLFTQLCLKSAVFSLGVKDLGFIDWKNVDTYIGDKNYTYNGYDIVDLLRPGNTGGDPTPDDVAKQLGIPKQKINRRTALPTKLQLGYLQKISPHVALKVDANYMFLPGYTPCVKTAVFFSAGKNFFVAPAAVVGGFGTINSQLGLGVTFAQTWSLQLNAMALEYLVMRNSYSGHGVDLFIAKSF